MASDDHDFAEINHIFVSPSDEEIRKIELRKDDPADRRSAAARQMGAEVNTLIDHFAHLLPEGMHKQSVIDCLHKVCLPEASLSDVFARLMIRLFEGHGLIMVDPTDTELKPLMSEVFTREILHPLASTKAVLETSEQLRKAGFTPQIDRTPDAVNLFLYDQGHRRAVTYKHDQFLSRHNGATFRREDLLKIISDNPAMLSHNVVTRPIVQDALFPSLAYIGGPSEVAYYAQFGKVYEYFGLPFPVIYPRASLTLVEPRIDRILKKHGLTIIHFTEDIKQVLNQRLQADMPDGIVDSLQSARKTMRQHYKTLFNQVTEVDPVLQGIVDASERKTAYALNKLEEKTLKALKRKNKTTRDQIMRADRQLYPLGGLQERSLNIWQYISLYGFEFMDTLFEAVDETDFSHRVISL
jgi:bacillithiol biosynthesis cysteine-adding enzyme BshC